MYLQDNELIKSINFICLILEKQTANGHVAKLQTSFHEQDRDTRSASNTPSHSRNNSNTSLNISNNGSLGLDTMQKSVGDVFNGFVIGVHRKMVRIITFPVISIIFKICS